MSNVNLGDGARRAPGKVPWLLTRCSLRRLWEVGWPAGLALAFHILVLIGASSLVEGGLDRWIHLHDGQFYVAHLKDPLLEGQLDAFDNVPYRAIRVGYVLFALPFRWLGEVPALVITNLLAVAVGALLVRRIAERNGADRRLTVLIWVINPGAIVSTALLLPDTVAWTLIIGCLIAIDQSQWIRAMVLGVLAVMTKEASLVALGIAGLTKAIQGERRAISPALAGLGIHALTLTYLTSRFGPSFHDSFLTLPFVGWLDVFRIWQDDFYLNALMGYLMFAGSVVVVAEWIRRRSFYLGAAAGHALLTLFLTSEVLVGILNSARISGLFWPLLVATSSGGPSTQGLVPEGDSRT